MDRSYVNRMEAGERGVPALATIDALAEALELSDAEADQLLAAAGQLPRSLRALGPTDPTLLLLAQRLTDPKLSASSRAALRATVGVIARHWGERAAVEVAAAPGPGMPEPSESSPQYGSERNGD
jgi:transcriptional regulator with XRE-family HTH domain